MKQRKTVERKLGIKSSIPKPQVAIAALYLIWVGSGKPSTLDYCDKNIDATKPLKLDSDIYNKIHNHYKGLGFSIPDDFRSLIEGSCLFEAQIEHLQVLFTLYWKLAKVRFVDQSKSFASERKGGERYVKIIDFTIQMDLLDLVVGMSQETFNTLIDWLQEAPDDGELSIKLKKFLTISSENTWFKDNDNYFFQEGIYSTLNNNNEQVTFDGESQGPVRILKKIVSSDIHSILKSQASGFVFKEGINTDYIRRVSNYLDATNLGQEEGETEAQEQTHELIHPLNYILYGAPGTGKSFLLNKLAKDLGANTIERVTFYSDYTYSQFVGGYKPSPVYIKEENKDIQIKDLESKSLSRPGVPTIEYSYVPGPLMKLLIQAILNPEKKYLLIIEELNRADAAGVFGDFFQLLDRNDTGESEYYISLSTEAKAYINNILVEAGHDPVETIRIPANLYLWATLNSADQGVYPIDTAFKRRWHFEYLPINQNEDVIRELTILLKTRKDGEEEPMTVNWNQLRKKINNKLSSIGVPEDLMIGPFFLNKNEMRDDKPFKHKLLAYLRDDILRHNYEDFFSESGTLDKIISEYDNGKNIFHFELD